MIHVLALATTAFGSSHREAPAISLDPAADITDVYAFVSPTDSSKTVLIMNVNPLETPGGGPNFHRFDPTVTYKINVDNEGDGLADKVFSFRFIEETNYPGEFLYNVGDISDPANLNTRQRLTLNIISDGVTVPRVIAPDNFYCAPTNVGTQSDPTGGYDPESSGISAITGDYTFTKGGPATIRTFCGPRQEGFYVDLERTFDLLNLAGADGTPNANTLLGYNVHSIAIEIPSASLTRDGLAPSVANKNNVIAVWSTAERRRQRVLNADGTIVESGPYVQVSRLGMPLVNEAAIAIEDKNLFNASAPSGDLAFLDYVINPILPVYMEAVLGIPNPGSYDAGLGIGGREDLILVLLTGIPGLTMPEDYALGGPIPGEVGKVFGAFEALRVNLATPSGFPNGRLVGDDVTDVTLSALAGLLIDGSTVSDGVDSTGLHYLSSFPFLGDPWAGDDHPNATHDL